MVKFIKTFIFIFIFLSIFQKANAITFKNFDELNECVDFYNSFLQYKDNLQECLKKKISLLRKIVLN